MVLKIFLILNIFIIKINCLWHINVSNSYPAFDPKFYESVLDPDECEKQLDYMISNPLLSLMFADSSAKIPNSILDGNLINLGNYHQCLSINYEEDDMEIKGKYCFIMVNLLDVVRLLLDDEKWSNNANLMPLKFQSLMNAYIIRKAKQESSLWKRKEEGDSSDIFNLDTLRENLTDVIKLFPSGFTVPLSLGICVPKVCTSHQAFNISLSGGDGQLMTFTEAFCRLPDDKPWSPADTVAAIVFLFIGAITFICTAYDVFYKFVFKRDLKNSPIQIFSAYTNGCRLVSVSLSSDTLRCLDGIRVLSTLWVIYGHSGTFQDKHYNSIGMLTWMENIESIYIISAPLAVDTFFAMSGILLVYNTCAKMDRRKLIRNLPIFYLSRLLRLYPLLATSILFIASFAHRISDGPMWTNVSFATDTCRTRWWITLLFIQNFLDDPQCQSHAWYIAIDFHLYIISPLVLFWVLGSKKSAWIALAASLVVTLAGAGVYNFSNNFAVTFLLRPEALQVKMVDYWRYYYCNILTRASPFIVGMVFGYLLHTCRGKRVRLPWHSVAFLWAFIIFVFTSAIFLMHFVREDHWEHRIIDNLLNTFMRPTWALAVGWMVLTCVHGYGGPVNWFLSLDMWRVPARLCYGAYLFHGSVISIAGDSMTRVEHFSPGQFTFQFLAFIPIVFLVSYLGTVLIDSPCSAIVKRMFEQSKSTESTKL